MTHFWLWIIRLGVTAICTAVCTARSRQYEPKPGPNGTLRTPGVTDFFRIMNEEIDAIRSMDDHGEVMFQTTLMALRIMRGFQVGPLCATSS